MRGRTMVLYTLRTLMKYNRLEKIHYSIDNDKNSPN